MRTWLMLKGDDSTWTTHSRRVAAESAGEAEDITRKIYGDSARIMRAYGTIPAAVVRDAIKYMTEDDKVDLMHLLMDGDVE